MQMTELKDIAGGALIENATAAIEQVIRNMVDLNTPYKDKRMVTIKLTFAQNENRDDASCTIAVSTKLAPVKPVKTSFSFGRDLNTGEIFVEDDGGAWKYIAMNNIRAYLNEELKDEKNIVILA